MLRGLCVTWPALQPPADIHYILSHTNIGTGVIKKLGLEDKRALRLTSQPLKAAVDWTVTKVALEDDDSDPSASALINTNWDIKELSLENTKAINPFKVIQIWTAAPLWPNLHSIHVELHPGGRLIQAEWDELRALVTGRALSKTLRIWIVRGLGVTDADIRRWSRTPWAGTLNLIELTENSLGPESLKVIAQTCPNIFHLVLDKNEIGNQGLTALSTCQAKLENLVWLDIDNNSITDVQALVDLGRQCRSLRVLRLSHNKIGNEGLKVLATGSFPELDQLGIAGIGIDDEGFARLLNAGQRTFPKLTTLNLGDSKIGLPNIELLCGVDWEMEWLCLEGCDLGKAEIAALAKAAFRFWRNLYCHTTLGWMLKP